jgi:hypothetical protein
MTAADRIRHVCEVLERHRVDDVLSVTLLRAHAPIVHLHPEVLLRVAPKATTRASGEWEILEGVVDGVTVQACRRAA